MYQNLRMWFLYHLILFPVVCPASGRVMFTPENKADVDRFRPVEWLENIWKYKSYLFNIYEIIDRKCEHRVDTDTNQQYYSQQCKPIRYFSFKDILIKLQKITRLQLE